MKCQNVNTSFNIYPKTNFKAKSIQAVSKPIEQPVKKVAKTLGSVILSGLATLGIIKNKNANDSNIQKKEISNSEFNWIKNKLLNSTQNYNIRTNIDTWLTKDNIEMYKWIVKHQNKEGKELADYIDYYGKRKLPLAEKVFYTPDIPHEHAAGIMWCSNRESNEIDTEIQRYRENKKKINELKTQIENYQTNDSKKPNKLSVLNYLKKPPYTQNMEYITYEKLVDFIENNEHSMYDSDILFSKDEETFDLRMDFIKFIKKNMTLSYINAPQTDLLPFSLGKKPRLDLFNNLNKENVSLIKELIKDFKLSKDDIIRIESYTTSSNIKIMRKICRDERFYRHANYDNEIVTNLSKINERNADIVEELYELSKDVDKNDFPKHLKNIIQTNRATVELCKAYGINPIIGIGNIINYDNAPAIKKIIDTKNYSDNEVKEITKLCKTKQSIELMEELGTDERKFNINELQDIFKNIFRQNCEIDKFKVPSKHDFAAIMQIAKCKEMPKKDFGLLMEEAYEKPMNFAAKLCKDKDFPKDKILNIMENITAYNISAAKALVECRNIKAEDIATILENTPSIKKEDIPYDILKSEIIKKHPILENYPLDSWNFILNEKIDLKKLDKQLKNNPFFVLNFNYIKPAFSNYAKTKNPNIINLHLDLIDDALKNKNLLKPLNGDLSDEELIKNLLEPAVISALSKIGKGTLESTFPLNIDGVLDFCEDISEMNLSPELYEKLALKIYPENSEKYKNLAKEIRILKEHINNCLTTEELNKRKQLSLQIVKYELRLQNENSNKKVITQKIKQLKAEKQAILYNCEKAEEIKDLMQQVSAKQKEMKTIVANKVNLSPQEIADKVQVVSQLPGVGVCGTEGFTIPSNLKIKNKKDAAEYLGKIINNVIDLIQSGTKENEEKWKEYINSLIYGYTEVGYNKELSDKLELHKSKYVSKIFTSSGDFFENFDILLKQINSHPDLSIAETIDIMDHNMETRRQFTNLGIDYNKWTKVDKNSYTAVSVQLDSSEAKSAAISNLEEDLNDLVTMNIPEEQIISLYNRLNENGFKIVEGEKVIYDENGFKTDVNKNYRYLYKGDKPIEFEDLNKIIAVIKEELNRNDFWTATNDDIEIEKAIKHLYYHLTKLRPAEFDNAKNTKDGEKVDVEVRKTDMYDIKKALGLGNDAACCTALGANFNEWTAPNYIMTKCIGAIELTDRGNYAGNTMIYLAKVNGELSLILDNIEMKAKYQFNNKIRDAFFEYARKLCGEIGNPDMPIYAGPNRHKVDMKGYPIKEKTMEIIGDSGDLEVYLDFDADGHKIHKGARHSLELYRIS